MGSEKSMKWGLRICSSKLRIPHQLTTAFNGQVADIVGYLYMAKT